MKPTKWSSEDSEKISPPKLAATSKSKSPKSSKKTTEAERENQENQEKTEKEEKENPESKKIKSNSQKLLTSPLKKPPNKKRLKINLLPLSVKVEEEEVAKVNSDLLF